MGVGEIKLMKRICEEDGSSISILSRNILYNGSKRSIGIK